MTIIANAFPKCGTNLVKKALGAMGCVHHDGGLVRHNMRELSRFVVPNGDGTKRQENIYDVLMLPKDHFIHAHLCYGGDLPIAGAKMIYIHRNPRDAAISMLRTGKQGMLETKEALLELITVGAFAYGPWVQAWAQFMCWTAVPWVLSVRFDEICDENGETIARMVKYLDLPEAWNIDAPRIAKGLHGNGKQFEGRDVYEGSSTWSGKHSSWKECEYWDNEVEAAWTKAGGIKVEQFHGYGERANEQQL